MPLYFFKCDRGHEKSFLLPVRRRNARMPCDVCKGPMNRSLHGHAPAVGGHHASQTMFEYERDKWELATGQRFENSTELETWAKENGKEIVGPNHKPPVQVPAEDREIDKALNDVWNENHRIEGPV